MTIRFAPSTYPGGRMLLMCGAVQAGAVFPPSGTPRDATPWAWRFWIGGSITKDGRAKTEQAAKNALLAELRDFLRASELEEAK